MGLPSKRRPKNKKRTINNPTNKSLKLKEINICPKCKNPKLQHRACKICGTYKESK